MGTVTNAGAENSVGSAVASSDLKSAGLGLNQPFDLPNVTTSMVAGLGTANNSNIGGYMLNLPFTLVNIDGEVAQAKFWTNTVPNQLTKWGKNKTVQAQGDTLFSQSAGYFSYSSNPDDDTPQAFQNLSGTLVVQGYITDKANLDLSSPINLNGSSTIELYYF